MIYYALKYSLIESAYRVFNHRDDFEATTVYFSSPVELEDDLIPNIISGITDISIEYINEWYQWSMWKINIQDASSLLEASKSIEQINPEKEYLRGMRDYSKGSHRDPSKSKYWLRGWDHSDDCEREIDDAIMPGGF